MYAYPLLKIQLRRQLFSHIRCCIQQNLFKHNQLKEMSDSGFWSIQSHTKTHYYMGQAVPGEKLKQELKESKERIQKLQERSYSSSLPQWRV